MDLGAMQAPQTSPGFPAQSKAPTSKPPGIDTWHTGKGDPWSNFKGPKPGEGLGAVGGDSRGPRNGCFVCGGPHMARDCPKKPEGAGAGPSAPRPAKIALRAGTPTFKGKGGGKGPPRRRICFDFARTGSCPRGRSCPFAHGAERLPNGTLQTLGHLGGDGEPPLWLSEYGTATWHEELECYICEITASGTPEDQGEGEANCLHCKSPPHCEELGWAHLADGSLGCLEVGHNMPFNFGPGPQPSKALTGIRFGPESVPESSSQVSDEALKWARSQLESCRSEAEDMKKALGPKLGFPGQP